MGPTFFVFSADDGNSASGIFSSSILVAAAALFQLSRFDTNYTKIQKNMFSLDFVLQIKMDVRGPCFDPPSSRISVGSVNQKSGCRK
jgi:hypothetical protein